MLRTEPPHTDGHPFAVQGLGLRPASLAPSAPGRGRPGCPPPRGCRPAGAGAASRAPGGGGPRRPRSRPSGGGSKPSVSSGPGDLGMLRAVGLPRALERPLGRACAPGRTGRAPARCRPRCRAAPPAATGGPASSLSMRSVPRSSSSRAVIVSPLDCAGSEALNRPTRNSFTFSARSASSRARSRSPRRHRWPARPCRPGPAAARAPPPPPPPRRPCGAARTWRRRSRGVAPRLHRVAREVPADVLRQGLRRGVAARGLLAQALRTMVSRSPRRRRASRGCAATASDGGRGSTSQTARASVLRGLAARRRREAAR